MSLAVAIERRKLSSASVDHALADVARLRRGYARTGNSSLPQTCWHLGTIAERFLKPFAPGVLATPEQAAKKAGFVDAILNGTASQIGEAPRALVASDEAGDEAIELVETQFRRLRDFPHGRPGMGSCGRSTIRELRTCHLDDAAHHLSFLVPTEAGRG